MPIEKNLNIMIKIMNLSSVVRMSNESVFSCLLYTLSLYNQKITVSLFGH